MCTVVERPVWLSDLPNNMEGTSDRISFEIIDVDANEGLAPSASGSVQAPRPQPDLFTIRGQPETISLLDDSDDDIEILSAPTQG